MRRAVALDVLTVGHSNRPLDEFLALLRAHDVRRVVDVRTVPRSRRVPWSSRDALAPALHEAGVAYEHLPPLGGLRKPQKESPNAAWRNAGFRGYADHMQTPEFQAGLERLLKLAGERRTAMMCAEAVPWRCHRSLVADALTARGAHVRHIATPAPANPHALTSFARVDGTSVTYPGPPKQARLTDVE